MDCTARSREKLQFIYILIHRHKTQKTLVLPDFYVKNKTMHGFYPQY
jgi:hypothetical protein